MHRQRLSKSQRHRQRPWNASNLIFDSARSPVANADDHAGVRLIRKLYPEFVPEDDFANARWDA